MRATVLRSIALAWQPGVVGWHVQGNCFAGKGVMGYSYFFVILGVIMCSYVFLTAASEFVGKMSGVERQ